MTVRGRGTRTPVAPREPRIDVPEILRRELTRLHELDLGLQLHRILWSPGQREDIEAEVVDDIVRIYSVDAGTAARALRHEVLHYEVAHCGLPLMEALNALLSLTNREVQRRQERLADRLTRLLEEDAPKARERLPASGRGGVIPRAGRGTFRRRGSRRVPNLHRGA